MDGNLLHFPQKEAEIISPDREDSVLYFKECRRGIAQVKQLTSKLLCVDLHWVFVGNSQCPTLFEANVAKRWLDRKYCYSWPSAFSTRTNLSAPFGSLSLAYQYSTPPVWNLSPPPPKKKMTLFALCCAVQCCNCRSTTKQTFPERKYPNNCLIKS